MSAATSPQDQLNLWLQWKVAQPGPTKHLHELGVSLS
jgi:hypothetical protein